MENTQITEVQPTQGKHTRIYWYDNAKFLLIALVVMVHFVPGPSFSPVLLYENHFLQTIELLVFMFVMQAFVFISGTFGKDTLTNEYIQKSIMQLIVPYVILCTIAKLIANQYITGYLLQPPPALWYLVALFVWRIALVVVLQFRWPVILSIVCALAIGCAPQIGLFLSLSRIFTFFPFFLLGYFYGDKILKIRFKYQRAVGISVFILAFVIIWFYFPIAPRWLLMSFSYDALGADNLTGVLIRSSLMLIASMLALAFFLLIPDQKTRMSEWGTRSIYPYVLHPLVALCFVKLGLYNNPPLILQLSLVPIAFFFAIILSSRLSEKIFSKILYPSFMKKIFVPLKPPH